LILSLNRSIFLLICLSLSLTWICSHAAIAVPSQIDYDQNQSTKIAQSTKRKRPLPKVKKKKLIPAKVTTADASTDTKTPDPSPASEVAFGFIGGWEAIYGNGMQIAYRRGELISQFGFGYNLSGVKFGGGLNSRLWTSAGGGLSLPIGIALVRSQGITDTVEIEGEFITESGGKETITGTRKYKLSPALYVSPQVGLQWRMSPGFDLQMMLNYNTILTGNEVEFYGPLEYTPRVVVTNDTDAQRQFEEKAANEVKSGGPGLSVGLLYFF
jgi:hypothetical protein